MQERSAKSRGWVSGLLRAGRAAAFLTLATGVNGLVSAYFSRYEPIYVYLVAVAVVGLTGGLLLGVTAAVAAVIVYDWMFSPVRLVPSVSSVVPLTVAVVAALASRLAQIPLRPRAMLAEPVQPPLLKPAPVAEPVAVIDDERVSELEEELSAARAAFETESRLRSEASAASRMREAQLQRELELLRAQSSEQTGRSGTAERDLQAMAAKLEEAESRLTAMHQELDLAWRKADEERARADREAGLRAQVETAGRDSIQKTIADLSSTHEAALRDATRRATEAVAALSSSQEELSRARQAVEMEQLRAAEQEAAVAVARAEAEKLRNKAEKLRAHLEEERARAAREAEMRQGLQTSAREHLEQTIRQISGTYESDLAAAKKAVETKDSRIADLQKALDAATAILQDERTKSEREAARRSQLEVAARETLQRTADVAADRQRAAAEAEKRAADAVARATALEAQVAALQAQLEQAAAERDSAAQSRGDLVSRAALQKAEEAAAENRWLAAEAEERAVAAAARVAALEKEIEGMRADVDRLIAERESSLRLELETSSLAALQAALDAASAHERASAEAQEKAAASEQRALMLQTHIDQLRSDIDRTLSDTQAHGELLEAELARVRSILEAEAGRADRETDLREQAETAAQQVRALLDETSSRYETALEKIRSERDAADVAAAAAREQLLGLTSQLAQEGQQLMEARAERERLMSDFDEKIQAIVANITTDHEHAIGELLVDKEAARAEIRSLTAKVQKLEAELAGGGNQRLQSLLAETATKYESALTSVRDQLQGARSDAAAAQEALESARKELDSRRAMHDETVAEFDQKLETIVAGLTSDYEQELGEAMVEKEAARAEVRTLAAKLQDVQQKLSGFDEVQAKVQRANDQLRAALAEARTAADQERTAREKSESEWNAKLQSIVSHLASDHEADVGEAMVAKAEARAEARNLTAKLAALQERLESDREKFRTAMEKWSSERGSLLERIKAAEGTRMQRAVAPTREEPLPEISERRTHPLVLFVHSDAGVRAMSKHTLEQAGYAIVTAADGLEGLRMAAQHRPDVVIAQAVMPKMNGRELIQLLKSRRETASTKVVLLGGSESQGVERGAEFRPDDVVPNPNDFRALRGALAGVLMK